MTNEPPGVWFETDREYDFQEHVWESGVSGIRVAVEDKPEPWIGTETPNYHIHVLPDADKNEAQPIELLAKEIEDLDEAISLAFDFMARNE